ncbi:MAG: NAD(P)/FAD-dependent oxidoreductase [Alphaproteobacteria bacterium]
MGDSYDLAIIGASFAGLVAAREAAARGLSVVVLERKDTPGAAMHTTGILVKEAAELMAFPAHLVRRIEGVRLYAPSLKFIDLLSEGYYFLATDTSGLIRWLADRARAAGAEIRCAAPFAGAEREGETWLLAGHDIAARYLIGADGARSSVAEHLGLGRNRKFLVGLEIEYDQLGNLDGRFLHTFLDRSLAPGYIAWVVPGAGVVQVGLACKRADKPNLQAFIERIEHLFDLKHSNIVERRSGLIPVGGIVKPAGASRVLLVGDAAGTVSPLTAGGIFTAFDFGARAGHAVADFLRDGAADPAFTLPGAYPRYRFKKHLRTLADLGPPNWLFNILLGTRPMRALAKLVYFHTKGLKSKQAWKDVVRK